MRHLSKIFFASCVSLFASSLWAAAPGTLDTTFGNGKGWVSTGFEQVPQDSWRTTAIQQADGKLVAVGMSFNGSNNDFSLARYNANGSLDTGFGVGGRVMTDIGNNGDGANSVIQQADGRLVVAGSSVNGGGFALVRYNANGSLDTTFNGTGKVTTVIGSKTAAANSVIQQADGKLVAAGYSYNGSNNDFALARYNADGSLDTDFGTGGKVITAIGSGADWANAVIQQTNGKLVVAGYSTNSGSYSDFTLVRYNTSGSLDTSFGTTGKIIANFGVGNDVARSVIQQADGKLVAAGYSSQSNNFDFALVRYNANGSLDTTFNSTGKVTTAIGSGSDNAYSVTQQADGKLVAAGGSSNGSNADFALVRYNANGSLDTTFNNTGKVTIGIDNDTDEAYSVVQQADGQLVAAGISYNGSNWNFALVRYNTNGSPDTTFNSTGKVTTAFYANRSGLARSVIQQADGKLVAAGYNRNGSNDAFALLRYNANGSLDTTFNGTGKVTTVIGSGIDDAYAMIQQADGKLVVAGASYNGSNNDFALVRYNANGTLDTTFNGTGKVTTAIGSGDDQVRSILQQADGKLVVAGLSWNGGSRYNFALARYNADGTLDTTFKSTGKFITSIGSTDTRAYSVIQQTDGKLVAAGTSLNGSNGDFALVRYNTDGTLDTTFNVTGKVTTAIGGANDAAYSVIQQTDGKLVVAGSSYNGSNDDIALVRYNADGSLDTTFNTTGKATTAVSSGDDVANSVVQQADGKLVAAGYSGEGFALVRYNIDGLLDATFNSTGKVTTAIGSVTDQAYSVVQQRDGKLAVAGYANDVPTGSEFLVARYESGQPDSDGDGYIDGLDNDDDNDGVPDASDAFPLNAAESLDTDADGIGNNADLDDDNDGVPDYIDANPLNAAVNTETVLPLNNAYKGSQVRDVNAVQ